MDDTELEEARTDVGQRRLRWLLSWIDAQVQQAKPALPQPDDVEVLVIATSWLRLALDYSRGIHELIEADQSAAAMPIYRALIELWAELDYLLLHGDPIENATRVQFTSLLELHHFFSKPEHANAQSLEVITTYLQEMERLHPRLSAEIRGARRKGRYHWSGLSRSGLIKAVGDDHFRELYSILSWDAHPTIHVLRDVEVDPDKGLIQFASAGQYTRSPGTLAYHCGGALYYLYNQYARAFALPFASTPENIDEILAEAEDD